MATAKKTSAKKTASKKSATKKSATKKAAKKGSNKGNPCWPGFEPVAGKKPMSKGSCKPES